MKGFFFCLDERNHFLEVAQNQLFFEPLGIRDPGVVVYLGDGIPSESETLCTSEMQIYRIY